MIQEQGWQLMSFEDKVEVPTPDLVIQVLDLHLVLKAHRLPALLLDQVSQVHACVFRDLEHVAALEPLGSHHRQQGAVMELEGASYSALSCAAPLNSWPSKAWTNGSLSRCPCLAVR
jgi:hypothetical protein